jgi:hypothetical protein
MYEGEIKLPKELQVMNRCDGLANEIKKNIKKRIKSHLHMLDGLLWYK